MEKLIFLILGSSFGFILSRAGATTYDFYAKLFLFRDLQLLWVIVTAVSVGAVGIAIFKAIKLRSLLNQEKVTFPERAFNKRMIPGSLLFGLGWGLAGACPGTALAMLGEGKLGAAFTILGIFIGTYMYGLRMSKKPS